MRGRWTAATAAATALLALSQGACGRSGARDPSVGDHSYAVARVAGTPITAATLAHWTAVRAAEGARSSEEGHSLSTRTLEYLISAAWQLGEASRLGLEVSDAEAMRRVETRDKALFPNGKGEADAALKVLGRTLRDEVFTTKVELAAARLGRYLQGGERPASHAGVVAYYAAHKASFVIPRRSDIAIVSSHSLARARKVRGELLRDRARILRVGIRETIEPAEPGDDDGDAQIAALVFSVPTHTLFGPVKIRDYYSVFEVLRATRARQQPLAKVEAAIAAKLSAAEGLRARAALVARWRAAWTAQTSCSAGYIAFRCREYSDHMTATDDAQAFD